MRRLMLFCKAIQIVTKRTFWLLANQIFCDNPQTHASLFVPRLSDDERWSQNKRVKRTTR